jgi:imidazolonepropionase-like amidohydrolase
MNNSLKLLISAVSRVVGMSSVHANNDEIIAFTGAQLLPITSPPIEGGTLILKNGKIHAIGKDIAIPSNAH